MLSKLFGKSKQKVIEISSPLSGTIIPLSLVPDEAFAGKHMGVGIAILPSEGKIIAPFSGSVAHLIHTNHAIILAHTSGLQLLIHIGINTVALNGDWFKPYISTGDEFEAGQILIEFDPKAIKAAGYSTICPVVIANEEEVNIIEVTTSEGRITAGNDLILTALMSG
ncbi:MAG: PTS glucose transporter subunit IIA [Candidatus Pristimantibacillus sp.]